MGIQTKLTIRDTVLTEDDLKFLRANHDAFGTPVKVRN